MENDVLALPIVADLQERQVIGMIRRQEIAAAYLRRMHGALPEPPPAEQS